LLKRQVPDSLTEMWLARKMRTDLRRERENPRTSRLSALIYTVHQAEQAIRAGYCLVLFLRAPCETAFEMNEFNRHLLCPSLVQLFDRRSILLGSHVIERAELYQMSEPRARQPDRYQATTTKVYTHWISSIILLTSAVCDSTSLHTRPEPRSDPGELLPGLA